MLTSAIIPCHNGVEDTRTCVAALLGQRGAGELEILIVDNGSTDGTAELDREFPAVVVLRQSENLGFAGGVNCGLRAARGDLFLVINNDTRAAPHMLAALQRALLCDSGIGLAAPVSNHVKGPACLDLPGDTGDAASCLAVEESLTGIWAGILQDVDTLAGLCWLMRAELVQRIGALDERFGVGNFEDDDFCLRARIAGYRLVLARDAFLHHRGHRTFEALGLDYLETLLERRAIFEAKWRRDPAGAATLAQLDGDLDRAARHAERALHCYPRWADAHWLLARTRAARGDHAAAIAALESFLELCPRHPDARILLAFEHMEAGRESRGRAELAWALRHCFVSEPAAGALLGRLGQRELDAGQADRAVDTLSSALALRPDEAEIHNLLGAALMAAGRLEEALPRLEEAERRGSPYGTTNTGICLWRLGRAPEAMDALHRAVAERPEDPVARRNLDAALAASGLPN